MENQTTTTSLPTDINALQQLVLSLQTQVETLTAEKLTIQEKWTRLLEQFKLANAKQFSSSSEKGLHQGRLFDEPGVDPAPDALSEAGTLTVPAHKRRKGQRKPLPANLPREDIVVDVTTVEKTCACCQKVRPKIGEEITEKLDIVPATLKVLRYVRPKYGSCCETDGVVIAKLPRLFLPKHFASPGLASHLIVSKYEQHMPLYRQAKFWQTQGVDYSRGTMCRTVLTAAEYCAPLLDRLSQHIKKAHYLQVDETTVQVMKEPERKNTTKSFMWCYSVGPPNKPAILFEYQPTRHGHHAMRFLNDVEGHVQCDGYSGYNFLVAMPTITRGGCLAHARRKFAEVVKINRKAGLATDAIKHFAEIYVVEAYAREAGLSYEARHQLRQEKSRPLMETLKAWLDEHVSKVPPKSQLGNAFNYTIKQWPLLMTYLDNGHYEIDNNHIENLIRPFALGRKNWLFSGSPAGAKAGALFYSLIATAKAHNLIPFDYLRYVFTHIRDCYQPEDYEQLLPHHLTPEKIKSV